MKIVKTRTEADSTIQRILEMLLNLSRGRKRIVMFAADLVFIPLMMYVALSLKGDAWVAPTPPVVRALLVATVISMPLFARIGLYRAVIRYMGPRAALVVTSGIAATTLILLGLASFELLTGLSPTQS